jgi:uncharacterized membrane protein
VVPAILLLGFGVLGLAISAYLTTVHYANVPLACSTTGVVDCAAVTTSSYSVVPGTSIPITVPGMAWFLVSGGLALVALLRLRAHLSEPRWLQPVHLGWALAGLATVLYLVWVEAVQLHRLCEWCTGVHVLVAGSLLVALWRWQRSFS